MKTNERGWALRGLKQDGKVYVLLDDVLLYLEAVGKYPNLNDQHREIINAMLKDLRASTTGLGK